MAALSVVVTLDTNPTSTAGGHQKRVTGSLHLSTSYTAGGDLITPGQVGLQVIDDIIFLGPGLYDFVYNAANGSVQAYWTGAGSSAVLAEVTGATDLHATNCRFHAYGV